MYQGQGLSLPAEFDVDGEWVIEDRFYIYRTNPLKQPPYFRPMTNYATGAEADGLDADFLAEKLGISTSDLFLSNQRHELRIVWDEITAGAGADCTVRIRVRTRSEALEFNINSAAIKGNA